MNYTQHNQLEDYVERHRADFDLHEPRPELWAALAQQLPGEVPIAPAPVMSAVPGGEVETGRALAFPVLPAQPVAKSRGAWAERYSLVAALAVLVLAAGLGEAWKSGRAVGSDVVATAATSAPASSQDDAALYLAPAGGLLASSGGQSTNARLDTAVRGMETYYVGQLAERKTQLSQLAPDATADWARELIELDSSYQQLKRELPQHPQPEVVLTAMNRNLQIRLDILDRQLELHGPDQGALSKDARGEYALADSRRAAENALRHDR